MDPSVNILRCLLRSLPASPPRDLHDTWLKCAHCNALLYQPSTLGDGSSLCLSCVDKAHRKKKTKTLLDGSDLHFGKAENKILSEITTACAPKLHEAARVRHESNSFFREKKYEEARNGYTKAIDLYSCDAVVWSNRSAASICLEEYGTALSDSETACRLLLEQGAHQRTASSPLLLKCLARRAHCKQSLVVVAKNLAKKDREGKGEGEAEGEGEGEGEEEEESSSRSSRSSSSEMIHTTLEACCLYSLVVAMYRESGRRAPATVRSRFADCFAMLMEEKKGSKESKEKEEDYLLAELVTMLGGAKRRRRKRKAEDLQDDGAAKGTTGATGAKGTKGAAGNEEGNEEGNVVTTEASSSSSWEQEEWRFQNDPADIFSSFVLHHHHGSSQTDNDDHRPQQQPMSSPLLLLDKAKLTNLRESLRCPLCFDMLHQPTTIPCG